MKISSLLGKRVHNLNLLEELKKQKNILHPFNGEQTNKKKRETQVIGGRTQKPNDSRECMLQI